MHSPPLQITNELFSPDVRTRVAHRRDTHFHQIFPLQFSIAETGFEADSFFPPSV